LIAGVTSTKAKEALDKSVDPNLLKQGLPNEIRQLNPKIEGASFADDAGRVSENVLAQPEMESGRSPLVVDSAPAGRGFSRYLGLPIRCYSEKSAKGKFRALQHRFDEPTRLSLGMVASLQSPLPFHPAKSL